MSKTSIAKSVLITGASSGIGFTTAELFLAKGWRVFGLSRSGRVPEGVVALIADINIPSELKIAFGKMLKKTEQLDAVVHAAGIGGAGPLECFPLEEARKIMETNFFGSVNVAQVSLPYLRQQSSSYLIFISSIAGVMGVPFHGVYSASKFATEGLVESMRQELIGSGVQVVSVCPGDTATPILGHQFRSKKEAVSAFYVDNYEKADTAMRESVNKGISPKQVAQAIFMITQKKVPKNRYFVGEWLQRISPYIKRIIPSWLFEVIMKKYYGLK